MKMTLKVILLGFFSAGAATTLLTLFCEFMGPDVSPIDSIILNSILLNLYFQACK